MILQSAYLGSVFTLLQAKIYSEPVNSIEKIIRHNYSVFVTSAGYHMVNDSIPYIESQYEFAYETVYLQILCNDDSNKFQLQITVVRRTYKTFG